MQVFGFREIIPASDNPSQGETSLPTPAGNPKKKFDNHIRLVNPIIVSFKIHFRDPK